MVFKANSQIVFKEAMVFQLFLNSFTMFCRRTSIDSYVYTNLYANINLANVTGQSAECRRESPNTVTAMEQIGIPVRSSKSL